MAGSTQIHFADDMIGDPNDLDDLIEATGRDVSDVSGDEERRQNEAEEDGRGSDNERQGSDNDGENQNKDAKSDDPPKKKKKLAPRLTLNPERLKGPRGLTALLKEFENFKFRGKGKEREDLERVLAKMEHWAHRLHPKLHFEDFIDKAEKLCSKKKEMQVYMNRMRMGLETGDDDIIREEDDEEEPRTVQNEALNEFDRLLDQQISYYDENPREHLRTPKTPSTLPPSPAFVPMMASTLTTEQKELIARKKKEAMERRLARLREVEEQQLREATAASLMTAAEETSDGVAPSGPASESDIQVPSRSTELSAEQRERAARNKQLALEKLRARRLAAQGIQQCPPDLNVSSMSDLAVPLSPSGSLASPKASKPRKSPIKSPITSSPTQKVVRNSNQCDESSTEETYQSDDKVHSQLTSHRPVSESIDEMEQVVSSDKNLSQQEFPSTSEKLGEAVQKTVPPQKDADQGSPPLASQRMDDVSSEENTPFSDDVNSTLGKMDEGDNAIVSSEENVSCSKDVNFTLEKIGESDNTRGSPQEPSRLDKLPLWEKMDEVDE